MLDYANLEAWGSFFSGKSLLKRELKRFLPIGTARANSLCHAVVVIAVQKMGAVGFLRRDEHEDMGIGSSAARRTRFFDGSPYGRQG